MNKPDPHTVSKEDTLMKRTVVLLLSTLLLVSMFVSVHAASPGKFGVDKRHEAVKGGSVTPSTAAFSWKMVTPWDKDLLFYNIAVHFCDTVRLASGGRLDIRPLSAGELVPGMQALDAVSQGLAEVGHDGAWYWKDKDEAFVPLGDVPFGLDSEGYNIWLYERGGLAMAQELYGAYNLFVLPCGQTGQDMGISSNKRATKMEDFKGMKVRTVGWYMDILNNLGAAAVPLPGGEVHAALKSGVVDGAEFSSPAMNYPMGFCDITRYSISPGVHQPASQCYVFFNQEAYDKLPEDLKWIVDTAAKETQLWSFNWMQGLNAEAIEILKEKVEFVQMEPETLIEFRKTTQAYLEDLKARHPNVKRILDSQEAFVKEFETWRAARGGVAPWTYETYISGKLFQ